MSQLNAQDRVALILGRQIMQLEGQADQIAVMAQEIKVRDDLLSQRPPAESQANEPLNQRIS